MESKTSNSKSGKPSPNKLSNTPFILLIILAFILLGYQYLNYNKKISQFANRVIPYIAQSVYINIYTTPADYPKYQWLFKGTLRNSIRVSNSRGDYVMIPKTMVNIPINVFNNSSQTRFTILANGIEQDIHSCDFIATTF